MDSSASESENESIQTDDSEHNYIPGLPPIVYDSIEVECVYNLDFKSLMTSQKRSMEVLLHRKQDGTSVASNV